MSKLSVMCKCLVYNPVMYSKLWTKNREEEREKERQSLKRQRGFHPRELGNALSLRVTVFHLVFPTLAGISRQTGMAPPKTAVHPQKVETAAHVFG